jgi:ring-1,2-phenylacetyl-CoA epoxidase subunit PaaD
VVTAVEEAVAAVADPEIRVVTIADLGILRAVDQDEHGHVTVTITPTYSGCPAMDVIRRDIETAARRAGAAGVEVRTELSPPWSTDWISETGRAKLAAAGTVPPPMRTTPHRTMLRLTMRCPRCGSTDTEELSRFGSTACKSLWRCRSCREPFDSIKAH